MPEQRERVKRLLDGLSDLEVREVCIAGLRRWHGQYTDRDQFSMHGDLGRAVLPILAERRGEQMNEEDARILSNVFIDNTALKKRGCPLSSSSWSGSSGRGSGGRSTTR